MGSASSKVLLVNSFNELKYVGKSFEVQIFTCYDCKSVHCSVFSEIK
jgi:hypothetical protein